MMYGTKLLDTEIELFAVSLSQTEVLVWLLNEQDVYMQVDSGHILKYTPDYVLVRSNRVAFQTIQYSRDQCEFSVRFPSDNP